MAKLGGLESGELDKEVVLKNAVCRVQGQLENASFLSASECVELAGSILQLCALDGRIALKHDLGLNESMMLIASSRVEIRNAYLLVLSMFHWFKKSVETVSVLVQNSYIKSSSEGEKVLILNALCLMKLHCALLLECYRPQILSLKLPVQQLNRWIVYAVKSTRVLHEPPGLAQNLRNANAYHRGLDTSTCSTLSQCLRPHIIEGNDSDFLFLIPAAVRRMVQCIRANEGTHFGIPNPWFLAYTLKLMRAFSPLRFRCEDALDKEELEEGPYSPPQAYVPTSENDDFLREWNKASVDLSQQFKRASTMPAEAPPPAELLRRRDSAPSTNYLIPPPRKHRFRSALKRIMRPAKSSNDMSDMDVPPPILSADLTPVALYHVMERFLIDLFDWAWKLEALIRSKRHSQNLLAMILSEAVQWIFFTYGYTNAPSDVLLDLAMTEFRRQLQHANAQMRRNSLDMFSVAIANANLRKRKLVRQVIDRLETLPNENFMKRGYFALLVDWYSDFGGEPDGLDLADWVLNSMVLSLSVRPANESTRNLQAIMIDPRLEGWTCDRSYQVGGGTHALHVGNETVGLICKLISLNVDAIDDTSLVDLVLQLVNTSSNWKPCYWLVYRKPYAVQQLILHGSNHFLSDQWRGRGAQQLGSSLGLMKLTIKLIGDSGSILISSELARFMQVLRGSSTKGHVPIPWWVDNELIVLSLDAACKLIPLLEDDDERNLMMNTVNTFVKHHNIDVQLCAAEKWLTIVKNKFSVQR